MRAIVLLFLLFSIPCFLNAQEQPDSVAIYKTKLDSLDKAVNVKFDKMSNRSEIPFYLIAAVSGYMAWSNYTSAQNLDNPDLTDDKYISQTVRDLKVNAWVYGIIAAASLYIGTNK